MNKKARHQARAHALQAIYQWQMTQHSSLEIETDFIHGNHLHKGTDIDYFKELIQQVILQYETLDEDFNPFLKIPLKDLDPIELAILRIATFELKNKPDIPWRVVIDESLELAKKFASIEGYKFINGVLDKVAKKLRPEETKVK